jgi:hypothetical protein
MVKHAFLVLLLAAGCYDDRYRCTSDAQCDLGEGGRCEQDGYCTRHDITCATQRRYSAHAGSLSERCFDDRVVPSNVCAGGQAPAKPEGCLATVCERLPACCELGWLDACAQVAQEVCDVDCDTRIAITATRNATTELWDARWNGSEWTFEARTDLTALAWVAPAPGTTEPRLAGAASEELVIGETRIAVPAERSYKAITSVGFDRDARDTVVASFVVNGMHSVERLKLDDGPTIVMRVPGSESLVWGDRNRDGFPDAIVENGTQYSFLDNLEDQETFSRKLSNQTAANVGGGGTPGAPPVRSFDWLDLNGDTELDLVVFGASVRVHTNPDGLRDVAERELDCDPPNRMRSCSGDPEPNLESASFAGAALPTSAGSLLVISAFPGRKLFRVAPDGVVSPLAFPGDGCSCTSSCTSCPGMDCTCTYNCTSCVPVVAIVVRDVDHDRVLDVIAIDAKLQLYVATAASGYKFGSATAIPTTFSNTFFSVDVSVTGAPIP